MRGHIFDIDILRACEINLKINVLEVLNIERKYIGQLLLCDDHFLFDFYARVQLFDLLLGCLHTEV